MGDRTGLVASLGLAVVIGVTHYAMANGSWTETFPCKVEDVTRTGPKRDDLWNVTIGPADATPVPAISLEMDQAEKVEVGDDIRVTRTTLKPLGLVSLRFVITREGKPVLSLEEGWSLLLAGLAGGALVAGFVLAKILGMLYHLVRKPPPIPKERPEPDPWGKRR